MIRTLVIPGRPQPFVRGARGAIRENTERKRSIRAAWLLAYGRARPSTEPCLVVVEFVFRAQRAADRGRIKSTRPDADNLFKLPPDALRGLAWIDDSQVHPGPIIRRWTRNGEGPHTRVRIATGKADVSALLLEAEADVLAAWPEDP